MKRFLKQILALICAICMLASNFGGLGFGVFARKEPVVLTTELKASDDKTYEITVTYEIELEEDEEPPEEPVLVVREIVAPEPEPVDAAEPADDKAAPADDTAAPVGSDPQIAPLPDDESAPADEAAAPVGSDPQIAPLPDDDETAPADEPADDEAAPADEPEPETDNIYDEYVKKAAKALDCEVWDVTDARVFDISLHDPVTGEEIQPPSAVKVNIRLLEDNFSEEGEVGVVHFSDDETVEPEVMDSTVSDEADAVEFETESFSVYVIIDHEAGEIVNPRVEFHFLDSIFTDNSDGTYTALPYEFINTGADQDTTGNAPTNVQTSQILTDSETLENIANPPNLITFVYSKTADLTVSPASTYFLRTAVAFEAVASPKIEDIGCYYELIGSDYTLTADSAINGSKTYYTDESTYEAVQFPTDANISSYYVKTAVRQRYFFGWYMVDDAQKNSSTNEITYIWDADPERIFLEKPVTISDVVWANSEHTAIISMKWTMNGVTHEVKTSNNDVNNGYVELDEFGCAHVYLAPIYEDYYFVNFRLGAKETAKDEHGDWDHEGLWSNVLTRRLIVLGSDGTAEIHIGLTAPPTDAKRQVFAGWETTTVTPVTETVGTQSITFNYPTDRVNMYETVDPSTGVEKNSAGHTDGYFITVKRDASIQVAANEILGTDKSIDLYPVFAEARWIYFDVGTSGNGATYVGAKYLLTSDNIDNSPYSLTQMPGKTAHTHTATVNNETVTILDDSAVKRSGYEFNGWYLGAVRDADGNIGNLSGSYSETVKDVDPVTGNELATTHTVTYSQALQITDANGDFITHASNYSYTYTVNGTTLFTVSGNEYKNADGDTLFKIVDGKLYIYKALDDLTLYAQWTPVDDTTFTVIIWKESMTDTYAANAAPDKKHFDFEKSYKLTGSSNSTATAVSRSTTSSVTDAVGTYSNARISGTAVGGANVNETLSYTGFYCGKFDENVTIAPEGTSVINVYYYRNVVTYKFYTYGNNQVGYTRTDSDNSTPQQYGYAGGDYVALTRDDGTDVTVWSPQDTYTATTSTNETTYYGLVNGEYVVLEKTYPTTNVTVYKLTNTLAAGNYLIVNSNSSGTRQVLTRSGTSLSRPDITVTNGSPVYILGSAVSSDSIWTVTGSAGSFKFKNGNYYLRGNSNSGNSYLTLSTSDSENTWGLNGSNLQYRGGNYLRYRDDSFTIRSSSSSGNAVYLYVEDTMSLQSETPVFRYDGQLYTGTRYAQTTGGEPYAGTRYTKDGTTYTSTTGEDGTQYGVDANGGHVRLNKGSETVYKWYVPEYGDVYTASDNTDEVMYGKIGDEYVELTRNDVTGYSYAYTPFVAAAANDVEGTQYALVDTANGKEYVELHRVDNPVPGDTYYILTSALTAGKEYLIVSSNSASNSTRYALGHSGTTVSSDDVTVRTGIAATGNKVYINAGDVDSTSVWTAGTGWTFKNGNYYLQTSGSGGNYSVAFNTSATKYWTWNQNDNRLSIVPGSYTTYYLRYNNGWGFSNSNNSVYLYEKTDTSTTTYTWTYTDGNGATVTLDSNATRYKVGTSSVSYNGDGDTRYTRSGATVWTYSYTATTADAASGQYGVDDRGGYVALTGTSGVHIGYSYSYNDEPYTGTRYTKGYGLTGESVEYTGTRWVRTTMQSGQWNLYRDEIGLYGEKLAWPTDSGLWWYPNGSSNGGTSGTRMTYKDAFLPMDADMTVEYYGKASSGSGEIRFYLQKIDNPSEYVLAQTIGSSSNSFNINDKFSGFHAYQYRSGNTGNWSNVGALNPSTGVYGSAVSFNTDLEIRYNRNENDLVYFTNYPVGKNLTFNGVAEDSASVVKSPEQVTVEDFLYGADLSGYAHYYDLTDQHPTVTLIVPDHYFFRGWYKDDSCTVEFDFSEPMPDGNAVAYAKWEAEEFLIRIDPDGGVIDHINHWGANEFEKTGGFTGKYKGSKWNVYEFDTFRPNENATSDVQKYNESQATFFWNYYDQPISEYATVVREYIEITPTEATAMRTAYTNATTDEERAANTVYYYLNTQYSDETEAMTIHSDARNALYLAESEVEAYYAFFLNVNKARYGSGWNYYSAGDIEGWKRDFFAQDESGNYLLYRHRNNKEFYTMLGWYEVFYDNQGKETGIASTPYNFADPVKGKVTLRALWRLDGGYIIQYTPEQTVGGKLINGDMVAWTDPETAEGTYAAGAKTNIYRQPDNITEDGNLYEGSKYHFIGWRLVSVKIGEGGSTIYVPLEPGVYYQPGDDWEVKASYADANSIIHMQAVYQLKSESIRRPEVINLTLNANTGYLVDSSGNELTADANLSWPRPGVVTMNAAADTITFGDIQSNVALRLYQYSTNLDLDPAGINYFKHNEGFLLIGFDPDSNPLAITNVSTGASQPYVPNYPSDSIISLARTDSDTLYAIWEPMVYITIKNETRAPALHVDGGPVTFNLSSTSSEALTIINIKNGMYSRKPLSSLSDITLQVGEEISFAVPQGKEKDITISGINNIGPGSILYVNSTLAQPYTSEHRTGDPEEKVADNTKPFSLTDILVEHPQGLVVTFTSDMHDRTLVFDQNFGNNDTTEKYFSHAMLAANEGSVTMPLSNTNFGFELQGWALTRDATEPLYAVDEVLEGVALTTFFGSENVKTLYAVWKGKEEARKVYVYKTVPAPGSLNEAFTFDVNASGTFAYSNYLNETYGVSMHETFTLKSNEYAIVESSQYLGVRYDDPSPQRAYMRFTITVFCYDPSDETWKPDASRAKTVTGYVEKKDVGTFGSYAFSIEEQAVQYYSPSLDVTAQLTKESESKLTWTNLEAGGTARFTNTHQVHTVTVEKTVVPATILDGGFGFTASYKLKNDDPVDLGSFSLSGGYHKDLTNIPAGAILTVTETEDPNYTTTSASSGGVVDLDTASNYVFKCAVTKDDTIVYTNTLKSFPVKIVLQGYDGTSYYTNVNADFTLERGATTLFSARRANSSNNVVYNTGTPFSSGGTPDEPLYVSSYKLKETWLESSYMALTPEFSFEVTKDGVSLNGAPKGVTLTTESSGLGTVYVITITNRKTVPVTITKILHDPLIKTTLDFDFSLRYYMDGVGDAVTIPLTITSGDFQQVSIPMNSRLVIMEDLLKEINGQTVNDRYDTTCRINSGEVQNESSVTIDTLTASASVTFTNTFKSSDITIKKVVEKDDDTNIFTFMVTLSAQGGAVKQYTLYDSGTPDDATDDLITDNNGHISFTLTRNTEQQLKIPIGARLTVQESSARDTHGDPVDLSTYSTTVKVTETGTSTDYSTYTYTQGTRTILMSAVPGKDLTLTFRNGFGVDVSFMKVDGFGNGLGNAEFTLYETYNGAQNKISGEIVKLTVNDAEATSVLSAPTGEVKFKVPAGTWYIRETGNPDADAYENNNNIYQIEVVSADNVTIKLYDGSAVSDVPDIATYGIMNISSAERRVILRKLDDSYNPLTGGVFELLRWDRTVYGTYDAGNANGAGGIFSGALPFGTYYLHETTLASGAAASGAVDGSWWYTVTVNADGVTCTARSETAP